jgi:hypothetical protein
MRAAHLAPRRMMDKDATTWHGALDRRLAWRLFVARYSGLPQQRVRGGRLGSAPQYVLQTLRHHRARALVLVLARVFGESPYALHSNGS